MKLLPIYYIGQKVWLGRTHMDGSHHTECPDCKGTGKWSWEAPSGLTGEVECPRCHGRRTLQQRCFAPHVEQLTIGSVRTDTAAKPEEQVSYMCTETGVGSGSVYYENKLFFTKEDAQAAADQATALANAELKQRPERKHQLNLHRHNIRDAAVIAAETALRKMTSRHNRLLERICELSEYNTVGERFCQDDELRSSRLEAKQIGPLQEALVWLDDDDSAFLENWREQDDECNC